MIHSTFLQLIFAGSVKKNKQTINKPQNQTKVQGSVSKTCPGNSVLLEL